MTDRLDEIRRRHAAATEGPWRAESMTHDSGKVEHWIILPKPSAPLFLDCADDEGAMWTVGRYDTEQGPHDAAFLAHSWQDVKFLLEEVERLRAEVAREARDRLHGPRF